MSRILNAVSIALALSATAPSVVAGDTGGFAGACKVTSSYSADKLLIVNDGFANGSSTGVANLTCGAVRLSTSSPRQLTVNYYDGHSTLDLWCTTHVRSWGGSSLWSQTLRRTNHVGAHSHVFAIPADMVGYVETVCSLPPTSPSNGARSYVRGFNLQ